MRELVLRSCEAWDNGSEAILVDLSIKVHKDLQISCRIGAGSDLLQYSVSSMEGSFGTVTSTAMRIYELLCAKIHQALLGST
jgi:hypothetical protein